MIDFTKYANSKFFEVSPEEKAKRRERKLIRIRKRKIARLKKHIKSRRKRKKYYEFLNIESKINLQGFS